MFNTLLNASDVHNNIFFVLRAAALLHESNLKKAVSCFASAIANSKQLNTKTTHSALTVLYCFRSSKYIEKQMMMITAKSKSTKCSIITKIKGAYLWSKNNLRDMHLSESNRANDQESDVQLKRNRKERNAQYSEYH